MGLFNKYKSDKQSSRSCKEAIGDKKREKDLAQHLERGL